MDPVTALDLAHQSFAATTPDQAGTVLVLAVVAAFTLGLRALRTTDH